MHTNLRGQREIERQCQTLVYALSLGHPEEILKRFENQDKVGVFLVLTSSLHQEFSRM